jgi:hypothetical protein
MDRKRLGTQPVERRKCVEREVRYHDVTRANRTRNTGANAGPAVYEIPFITPEDAANAHILQWKRAHKTVIVSIEAASMRRGCHANLERCKRTHDVTPV